MASGSPYFTIYTYLMPILAGLTLLTVICRALMIWQKERNRRAASFALVYVALFVLFLFFSLYARMTPLVTMQSFLVVTTAAYLLLAGALLAGNWYEWSDLVGFLSDKSAAAAVGPGAGEETGADGVLDASATAQTAAKEEK